MSKKNTKLRKLQITRSKIFNSHTKQLLTVVHLET